MKIRFKVELEKKLFKWIKKKLVGENHTMFYTFPDDVRADFGVCRKPPLIFVGVDALLKLEKYFNKKIEKKEGNCLVTLQKVILSFLKPCKIKITFTVVYYDEILKKWFPILL